MYRLDTRRLEEACDRPALIADRRPEHGVIPFVTIFASQKHKTETKGWTIYSQKARGPTTWPTTRVLARLSMTRSDWC